MAEPSGPAWCARFPGSASPDDLLSDFRDRVLAFLADEGRGREAEHCRHLPPAPARLSDALVLPYRQFRAGPLRGAPHGGRRHPVDAQVGVSASRAAARAMMNVYGIIFPAALVSRHTQRRAIDMTISWNGTLAIRDFNARLHRFVQPAHRLRSRLIEVGRHLRRHQCWSAIRRTGPMTGTSGHLPHKPSIPSRPRRSCQAAGAEGRACGQLFAV